MKRKKMKPVVGWCATFGGKLCADWCYSTRQRILYEIGDGGGKSRVVRVEIREAPKRRKAVRK